jgi:hypothetical protein
VSRQQSLFGEPEAPDAPRVGAYGPRSSLPYSNGSTSKAAAEAKLPTAGSDRRAALEALRHAGPNGLTREEIAERAGITADSCRPRCLELIAGGLVVETTRTRQTLAGRKALVLIAGEFSNHPMNREG